MRSIAETEYFRKEDQRLLHLVQLAVSLLPTDIDKPRLVRCHELARAVKHQFPEFQVVDGKYGTVEHSWCTLPAEVGGRPRTLILDPYAIGRLPQVQLIDTFPCLCHTHDPRFPVVSQLYRAGVERTDILEDTLKRMNTFLDTYFKPRLESFERMNERVDARRK